MSDNRLCQGIHVGSGYGGLTGYEVNMEWMSCLVGLWLVTQVNAAGQPGYDPDIQPRSRYGGRGAPAEFGQGAPATQGQPAGAAQPMNGGQPINGGQPANMGQPPYQAQPSSPPATGYAQPSAQPAAPQGYNNAGPQGYNPNAPAAAPQSFHGPRNFNQPATGPQGQGQGQAPGRSRVSELHSSLTTLPTELQPVGRWMTLREVLAQSPDRSSQLELTLAYWKLGDALAMYHLAWLDSTTIKQLNADVASRPASETMAERLRLQLELTSAASRFQNAEQKLLAAQYELAERMHAPPSAPFPLATDRPHVGSYLTYFDQIYGSHSAPAQACVLDRVLPLRRAVIEARAAAMQAAYDVFEASREGYFQRRESLTVVLADFDKLDEERQALLVAVHKYNDDIALYALNIPRSDLSVDELVGMLIKPDPSAVASPITNPNRAENPRPTFAGEPDVKPAAHEAPVSDNTPLADKAPTARIGEPSDLPAELDPPANAIPAAQAAAPNSPQAPGTLPRTPSDRPVGAMQMPSPPPAEMPSFGPQESRYTSFYASVPGEQLGVYQGLFALPPSKRAQELAGILHWNPDNTVSSRGAVALDDCLANAGPDQRRAVLAGYWRARESQARALVIGREIEQLESLMPTVMQMRQGAAGPQAMLRFQRARLDLKTQAAEAELAATLDRYQLTQLSHRPLDGAWLLPITVPHGGGYKMNAENRDPAIAESFTFRRALVVLPATHNTLMERAGSVVLSDAARATATSNYVAGRASIDDLLASYDLESRETRAFLATVTQYNVEIGDYALAVLPPQTPVATIVRALVVQQPSTRR